VQAVDLNLASRPFRNDTLVWVGFLLSLSLVGYVTWWNVNSYLDHRVMLADLGQRQVSIGRRMDDLDRRDTEAVRRIGKFNLGEIDIKSYKANHVIRFKSFSWTRLFNLLQEVQPYDVQMTSIHPVFRGDPGRRRNKLEDPDLVPVAVEGIAKSLKNLLELERSLIQSVHFDRVEPEHYAVDEHTREVVFRMRFLYDPRVAFEEQALLLAADVAVEDQAPPAPHSGAGEAAIEAAADSGGQTAAAAGASATTDEVEPSGTLASDKLKKIDRGGRGKRAGKNTQPATQPETPPADPADPTDPVDPADDADEGQER